MTLCIARCTGMEGVHLLTPTGVGESRDSKLLFCAMDMCDQNARRHIQKEHKLDIRLHDNLKYLSGMCVCKHRLP